MYVTSRIGIPRWGPRCGMTSHVDPRQASGKKAPHALGISMKLSVHARVVAAISASLLLLVGVSIVSFRNNEVLLEMRESTHRTDEIRDTAHRLYIALVRAESAHRGYALSGDRQSSQELAGMRASVPLLFGHLRKLSAESPSLRGRVSAMEPLIDAKLKWLSELALGREKGGLGSASRLFTTHRGYVLMEPIVSLLLEITDETARLVAHLDSALLIARRTSRNMVLLGLFGLFLNIALIVNIDRSMRQAEHAKNALGVKTEDLRRANVQLEATNQELESFCYSVSHDLRAPLRSITSFTQIIERKHGESLDPEALQFFQRVEQSGLRMSRIIDGLLSLSRLTRGNVKVDRIDMSLIAGTLGSALLKGEQTRQIDFHVEPGLMAAGDETLVRIILQNLIENAFKFPAHHASYSGSGEDEGRGLFRARQRRGL